MHNVKMYLLAQWLDGKSVTTVDWLYYNYIYSHYSSTYATLLVTI